MDVKKINDWLDNKLERPWVYGVFVFAVIAFGWAALVVTK